MFNLRSLFTRESIAADLEALPEIKTPVMDSVFTDRPQHPLPVIGVDEALSDLSELPVVRRGSRSMNIGGGSGNIAFYEPMPLSADVKVTGADLNNFKVLKNQDLATWARAKTDYFRRRFRRTTETICALVTGGSMTWPCWREGGGFEPYSIDYGTPVTAVVPKVWDASGAAMVDVFTTLTNITEALEANGYGGEVEYWAGKDAYRILYSLAENFKSTAKLTVGMTAVGIDVGGYVVKRRAETYKNPQTSAVGSRLGAKMLRAVAKDGGHKLFYCALDDLEANLQALPLFINPNQTKNPSGYELIAQSKPFPVVNMKAIGEVQVLT